MSGKSRRKQKLLIFSQHSRNPPLPSSLCLCLSLVKTSGRPSGHGGQLWGERESTRGSDVSPWMRRKTARHGWKKNVPLDCHGTMEQAMWVQQAWSSRWWSTPRRRPPGSGRVLLGNNTSDEAKCRQNYCPLVQCAFHGIRGPRMTLVTLFHLTGINSGCTKHFC